MAGTGDQRAHRQAQLLDRTLEKQQSSQSDIASLPRVGGHLALDFANTAGWHEKPERARPEHLRDYSDVVAWTKRVGTISAARAAALLRAARSNPAKGAKALKTALEWREAVYAIFSRVARGSSPRAGDLLVLHQGRLAALTAAAPVWHGRKWVLDWSRGEKKLLYPLYPVLLAAAECLEAGNLDRIRQCGNHPCGWLFVDRSRNGSRRWCSSAECGNAVRVRAFRRRAQSNRENHKGT